MPVASREPAPGYWNGPSTLPDEDRSMKAVFLLSLGLVLAAMPLHSEALLYAGPTFCVVASALCGFLFRFEAFCSSGAHAIGPRQWPPLEP